MNSTHNEPVGKLTIVSSTIIEKKNSNAIYWRTVFQDEQGNKFKIDKSHWLFELEKEDE